MTNVTDDEMVVSSQMIRTAMEDVVWLDVEVDEPTRFQIRQRVEKVCGPAAQQQAAGRWFNLPTRG